MKALSRSSSVRCACRRSAPAFSNGLYERYTGFNKFELIFAKALDGVGPSLAPQSVKRRFLHPAAVRGRYCVVLPGFHRVEKEPTSSAWIRRAGTCCPTAVARKLFDIKEDGKTKVQVRFITEGKQAELRGKAIKGGYTVWKMKLGTPTAVHLETLDKAVVECLR